MTRACLVALLLAVAAHGAAPPDVRFTQHLGVALPLNTVLLDESGRRAKLTEWIHGRPAVLWFGYARCPQLCGVIEDGMVTTLRQMRPSVGRDFDVIRVGIDPGETVAEAAAAREVVVGHYGRPRAREGWHYLVGNADAIAAVTDAAGFGFRADPERREYAHPSGFVIVTPEGRISAYFFGVDYSADDLAAALDRAKGEGIGARAFDLVLLCFRGDEIGGKYGPLVWRLLWVGVLLTILTLGTGIGAMLWREFHPARKVQP